MDAARKRALADCLIAMGDDELILAHRDSEWCGHAPILEEDIAFANIALDELGHARLWYELAADLLGEQRESYPDRLGFTRKVDDFRCVQMVELPNGDWAFSMVRQYLFDAFEVLRLGELSRSGYKPLAEAAEKVRREEMYHLRHTRAWVRRLGLGTEESNRRMQEALDALWPYSMQLFLPMGGEQGLVEAGLLPSLEKLCADWRADVEPYLGDAGLELPEMDGAVTEERESHSVYLDELLAEMQQVARIAPGATW